MADVGVKTTDLVTTSIIDELVGNRSGITRLISTTALSTQLLASGPIASAIAGLTDAYATAQEAYNIRGIRILKDDNGPILLAASGQSNIGGNANDNTGDDTTIDLGIKILNNTSNLWQTSVPGEYPYHDTYANTPNWVHSYALRLRQETGRLIYIVFDAKGSMPLSQWTTGWVSAADTPVGDRRDMFGYLSNKVAIALATTEMTSAGKLFADQVLWGQGEANALTATATYRTMFLNDVLPRFTGSVWFDETRPFLCCELPHGTAYATQNELYSKLYTTGRKSLITIPTAGLTVDSSGVHYDGNSLTQIGYVLAFNALMEHMVDPAPFYIEDPYYGFPDSFARASQIPESAPLLARGAIDLLCSTTDDGLRAGANVPAGQRGKIGYRTLRRTAVLTAGQTVPADMPGGFVYASDDVVLPTAVFQGYSITVQSTANKIINIDVAGAGTVKDRGVDRAGCLLFEAGDSVELVAENNAGSAWTVKTDSRKGTSSTITIANGAAASIYPAGKGGWMALTINPLSASPNLQTYGLITYDVGSTPNIQGRSMGTLFDVVAGDVTGATGSPGTDTKIYVGVIADAVRVQNRTGGTVDVKWQCMA